MANPIQLFTLFQQLFTLVYPQGTLCFAGAFSGLLRSESSLLSPGKHNVAHAISSPLCLGPMGDASVQAPLGCNGWSKGGSSGNVPIRLPGQHGIWSGGGTLGCFPTDSSPTLLLLTIE